MSTKKGRYTCDNDCPNWNSMKLCSHTVAVAEMNSLLQEFCELYEIQNMYQACHNLLIPVYPVVSATKANKSNENV